MKTRKLRNGWTIVERESVSSVYVAAHDFINGRSGRYTARFYRIPSTRTVEIYHFVGTTAEEQNKSLIAGAAIANGKMMPLLWKRLRMKNGRNWYFSVTLGSPINEAEEFERLRRGLHTDAAIDLEFEAILQKGATRAETLRPAA